MPDALAFWNALCYAAHSIYFTNIIYTCMERSGIHIQVKIQYWTAQEKNKLKKEKTVTAAEGANLLDVLRENGVFPEAACNGRGICGKCRVQIRKETVQEEQKNRDAASGQLQDRYCLACQVRVHENLTVCVADTEADIEADIQVLGLCSKGNGSQTADESSPAGSEAVQCGHQTQYSCGKCVTDAYIAVDIGSTTLAAVLTDVSGGILAQAVAVNSQRRFGADVISRMQASNEGKGRQLKECICRDLEELFARLIRSREGNVRILKIAAAGNTTMLHLLRGYSCEGLGRFPFEPVSLELECLDYGELFAGIPQCRSAKVYLLPGMSAFVGADITAGLYSSGFWQTPETETAFFLDLGTNGEMAFGSRDGFVTASAPAGPAFEGGGLSCGMPSVPGAVSKVSYLYHRLRVQTVGQKKPCGICGTGALEAAAALLAEGLMDTDGLLCPQLFETGLELAKREDGSRICLTQADIRKIQMAKAAVRSGIEIVQRKYWEITSKKACDMENSRHLSEEADGNTAKMPQKIYLAGGFGYYLSAETAAAAGLFPPEWKERIVLCGNACLKGAAAFLSEESCGEELKKICSRNYSVRLESEPEFQDIYMQNMSFPKAE